MGKRIITISREFGSGGRTIGKMVAESLGISFYDKELIALVAKEGGFSLEFVEETGEYSTTSSLLFNIVVSDPHHYLTYPQEGLSISDRIQILQTNIIQEIARKEACVIVGRSADYILRDRPDCLNVFIHADMASKVDRAINQYGLPEKNIERTIEKRDKARANHYRHYTGRTFGQAKNYHISLNSSEFGLETCRDIIMGLYKR